MACARPGCRRDKCSALSRSNLVEQLLGLLQIERIEALLELAVDRSEQFAGLLAPVYSESRWGRERGGSIPFTIYEVDIEPDDEKRVWIMKTMNTFANVLRPRFKKWYEETRRDQLTTKP